MHKQAINHKQAIIGGGYLFTENACFLKKYFSKTFSYYICLWGIKTYHGTLYIVHQFCNLEF